MLTKDADVSVNRKVIDFHPILVIKRVVDIRLEDTNFEDSRDFEWACAPAKGSPLSFVGGVRTAVDMRAKTKKQESRELSLEE
jgi:hypothetical protein